MRQSMTVDLDPDVLEAAKDRARAANQSLPSYVEALILHDLQRVREVDASTIDPRDDAPVTVFLAEPITERLIVEPDEGDTAEDVAERQEFLDAITGWHNRR